MTIDAEELRVRFAYHKPSNDDVVSRHEQIRHAAGDLAALIVKLTPDSREQSLAITACEEAMLWANAAIARRGNA